MRIRPAGWLRLTKSRRCPEWIDEGLLSCNNINRSLSHETVMRRLSRCPTMILFLLTRMPIQPANDGQATPCVRPPGCMPKVKKPDSMLLRNIKYGVQAFTADAAPAEQLAGFGIEKQFPRGRSSCFELHPYQGIEVAKCQCLVGFFAHLNLWCGVSFLVFSPGRFPTPRC